MTDHQMTATIWQRLDTDGELIRTALMQLAMTSDELPANVDKLNADINREVAIGPLMNPTAYVDGTRFTNADKYRKILRLVMELIKEVRDD